MRANFNLKKLDVRFDQEGIAIAQIILFKTMIKAQGYAKLEAPKFTGDLARSIDIEPKTPDSSEYTVFSSLNYASVIEYGSKPHVVPIEPLETWARRTLGDEDIAYAIQNKIKNQGTNPQPFFRPAFDQARNVDFKRIAKQEFRKRR